MNTKKTGEAPGKIQVCVLPEDLSSVDEVLRSYVAANEGVFECTPPESAEGTWEINGVNGVLIGHRKGERNLLFFRC